MYKYHCLRFFLVFPVVSDAIERKKKILKIIKTANKLLSDAYFSIDQNTSETTFNSIGLIQTKYFHSVTQILIFKRRKKNKSYLFGYIKTVVIKIRLKLCQYCLPGNSIVSHVIKVIFSFFFLQIRGQSIDFGTICGGRNLRQRNDLLQRHSRFHVSQCGKHPTSGGRSAQRSLHVFRFHNRELRRIQGEFRNGAISSKYEKRIVFVFFFLT